MGPRLKSNIWVQAQLRQCDRKLLPCVVARRGDGDAGQILIKRDRRALGCELLARRYTAEGNHAWMVVVEGDEAACDAFINNEINIDSDLWVLDIEDVDRVYQPD